jgi:hypothetical protein
MTVITLNKLDLGRCILGSMFMDIDNWEHATKKTQQTLNKLNILVSFMACMDRLGLTTSHISSYKWTSELTASP